MNYLQFLVQWYNWPYMAALLLGALSFVPLTSLDRAGRALGGWLGFRRVSGRTAVRTFALAFSVVGLTINGALHDYWPSAQESGFVPGLILTTAGALLFTRGFCRSLGRNFPEIRAVGWGSPNLSGREGRVVSRLVSPDYRAGRAQIMIEDDETLHMVMIKTREGEIPYGATVVLGEYDDSDGRYYVEVPSEEESAR